MNGRERERKRERAREREKKGEKENMRVCNNGSKIGRNAFSICDGKAHGYCDSIFMKYFVGLTISCKMQNKPNQFSKWKCRFTEILPMKSHRWNFIIYIELSSLTKWWQQFIEIES